MDRPKLEVADVFRRYGEAYREKHGASMSTAQRRVMTAIEVCRTAALGGHLERCDQCGHERNAYNSVPNRHCPKCQSLARARMDRESPRRTSRCPVFPCGVHRAGTDRRDRLSEQGGGLRHSLPGHRRDPDAPSPPIPSTWVPRSASSPCSTAGDQNLHASSAPALRRARRRIVAGRHSGGSPAGPDSSYRSGCCPACSAACFWRVSQKAFDAGKLQFFSSLEPFGIERAFLPHLAPLRETRMGRLRQAPVRRTPAGAGLRWPLYPSRRHLQQSPAGHRKRASDVSDGRTIVTKASRKR